MRKELGRALLVFGIFVILEGMTFAASWIESKNQGMYIRHPKGWKVDWIEQGVGVFHPQDPMIWSVVRSEQFQGSSRQVAEEVVKGAAKQVGDVKPLIQKQVSQRPDFYGIKFSGQQKGIPFTSLVLVVTEDRRNFVIREYSAPTKVYDEMKLTLVPILCSFCGQESGGAGGASASGGKGWQVIQSPHGLWRFAAPVGWMLGPGDEEVEGSVASRNMEAVFVKTGSGSGDYLWLMDHRLTPPIQRFPLLPATDLFSHFILPFRAATNGFNDVKIVDLKSIRPDLARFTTSFSDQAGHKFIEEGLVKNNPYPNQQGGDFNLYTMQFVGAPADRFPSRKDELWRIVSTFESSPQFGTFWVQAIMKFRRDNQQAATNMVLQTMQSNKQIMQQHVAVAQQRPAAMAQQGQGWINAVTGQEVVRDPQSGQRWQVPVGGQYIYGRNTGEIIRADRPLQTQELPEGFKQFEAVK